MMETGVVITVHRGGCEAVHGDQVVALRLTGHHAEKELALAVGDDITFDAEAGIVHERLPRRTRLARKRKQAEQVIAANMDRLAIIASFVEPPFRSGLVDRFQLAAYAGGLEAVLVVNKRDLLEGAEIPEEVRVLESVLPVYPVSALTGEGVETLRRALVSSRTVFAGHSGVGKSSLLNALSPDLRLETGALSGADRGRHITTRSLWLRLPGEAVVVDTPGVREIASGPVALELLGRVYPDIEKLAPECRFRNCRHDQEPQCAIRAAVELGLLPAARIASYRRLLKELDAERRAGDG